MRPDGSRSFSKRAGEFVGHTVESACACAVVMVQGQFLLLSAAHWLNTFREYYGPMHKAFEALDTEGRSALQHDLLTLANEHNSSGAGAIRIPAEYLEVVAVKAR